MFVISIRLLFDTWMVNYLRTEWNPESKLFCYWV